MCIRDRYTIILWVLFRRPDAVSEMLQVRNDSYRKQIDTINKGHEDEIAKRNIILEKYNELITNITEEYKKDSKNLKEEQKKEIKKLVEQYHDNPDELAKLLAEEYGFAYVE